MTGHSRRDALALAGTVAATGVLAACTRSTVAPAPMSTGPGATRAGRPSAPPSTVDWRRLASELPGRLLLPDGRRYPAAARLYNPRFDQSVRPAAIARVGSPADVAVAVRFAAETGVAFAVRSGGHAYPGWSGTAGLVIDVSGLTAVTVDAANQVARVGAGARLAAVYAALAAHGAAIPAGSCPTVGMAGLALGGGIGMLMRAWGLTCDVVRTVDVVTADGTARRVDATRDADLFWALRGGGGGSFGVVTAFTVDIRPAPVVSTFYLEWPFSAAADVLAGWPGWITGADRRLSSTCKILTDPRLDARTALVAGTWIGPPAELSARLAPLLARLPAPSTTSLHAHRYADAMLLAAGCGGRDADACMTRALAPTRRRPFAATSSIMDNPVPGSAIDVVVDRATAALDLPGLYEAGVSFDALGGAVADPSPDATAFAHRSALATVQYTATWLDSTIAPDRFDGFVRESRSLMAPWFGAGAYLNYADAAIADYPRAYWGANYPRLQQVKLAYDPHGLFTFPQAVHPKL